MFSSNAARPRESFGEQAARFSMYAPLVALALGCLARTGRADAPEAPNVALIMAWTNIGLIVAGFALGIVALISMSRFGPQRILGRAIVGVLLNGAVLTLLMMVFLNPVFRPAAMAKQVAGQWRMTNVRDPQIKQLDLTLNADNTFALGTTRRDGAQVAVSGKWVVTGRAIGITIEKVNGQETELTGKKIGLGNVKKVDEKQLLLGTEKGDETYERVR